MIVMAYKKKLPPLQQRHPLKWAPLLHNLQTRKCDLVSGFFLRSIHAKDTFIKEELTFKNSLTKCYRNRHNLIEQKLE